MKRGNTIQLYNSLGRKKETLIPRIEGQIGIYVCGVTVYDYCHIGHARVMVVFDVIVRHLRAQGYKVNYVRNFTDIDDKIIRRANALKVSIQTLTEQCIDAFHQDMDALMVERADCEPRATDHLPEMQEIIQKLIQKERAYQSGLDVYYAVDRFLDYGKLSGKTLADLNAGSRVEVDANKKNPLDFVLWKGAKPGEPSWSSPWGEGRPGWHIECSAMSGKHLGGVFDIHGGGLDLMFPHHENEIAQSEGMETCEKPWVRYWMHNGFVNVVTDQGDREKMSKSLDNFFTIRDLLTQYKGEDLRFFILNSHYRSPMDFSPTLLDSARNALDRLYSALEGAEKVVDFPSTIEPISLELSFSEGWSDYVARFFSAMDDDFNSPQAIAVLFDVAKQLNVTVAKVKEGQELLNSVGDGARLLRGLGMQLGLLIEDPKTRFQTRNDSQQKMTDGEIEALIQQRLNARNSKNFQEADRIRGQLSDAGVILQDAKEATTWRWSS